ncbi:hypothetical protein ACQP2H_30440 [Micromonospora sp. CA-248260]|uniref:hypothetical protein n=1 Tax=Micromonospora sp. CA-248260 TaxID=3239962 RepID=UPI003D906C36
MVQVAQAVFPKGRLATRVRDEWEVLFTDAEFADLFPVREGLRGEPGDMFDRTA